MLHSQTRPGDRGLERCDRIGGQRLAGGNAVLPHPVLLGRQRAEVPGDRSHIAVEQLEPGLGEFLGQFLWVVEPTAGDLLVDRVHPHREVGGEHRRVSLALALGHRHRVGPAVVLRLPLIRAGRTLGQLPLVAVKDLQVAVVPLGRGMGPDDLQAAGERVVADTGAGVAVGPAEAHLVQRSRRGLGAHQVGVAVAMGLAERMAADDQSRGLDIVHRHPAERLADIDGRGHRIRLTLGPFGIDVDQAHHGRTERILEFGAVAACVAVLRAQPLGLGAPVDVLFRLPVIGAAERKAGRLEAHRLQRAVAGEDDQIRPRQLLAVLLLDRPQEPARLVQARVIRPAVQGREPLHAPTTAAAAVLHAVGTGGVPGHPDEEGSVVAEVGGPPVLGIGHHGIDVTGQCIDVQGLDRRPIVVAVVHRVDDVRILLQHFEIDGVRPPIAIAAALDGRPDAHRTTAGCGIRLSLADGWMFVSHVSSFQSWLWVKMPGSQVVIPKVVGRAIGAAAPVDDFGFVKDEASQNGVFTAVEWSEARRVADPAVDICDGTATAAHHVVVIVADPCLIAGHRP